MVVLRLLLTEEAPEVLDRAEKDQSARNLFVSFLKMKTLTVVIFYFNVNKINSGNHIKMKHSFLRFQLKT